MVPVPYISSSAGIQRGFTPASFRCQKRLSRMILVSPWRRMEPFSRSAHSTQTCTARTPVWVYVFERRHEKWHQAAVLSAGDATPGDEFGLTVSVSGETIAVGARLRIAMEGMPARRISFSVAAATGSRSRS